MTNQEIQKQITGMIQKTTWSVLWQKKLISVSDVSKKGYKEASVRVALAKFVKKGWAVKPEGTRNTYALSKEVTK